MAGFILDCFFQDPEAELASDGGGAAGASALVTEGVDGRRTEDQSPKV